MAGVVGIIDDLVTLSSDLNGQHEEAERSLLMLKLRDLP
jgi:hypothetical protein